jgi:hypothetical protein
LFVKIIIVSRPIANAVSSGELVYFKLSSQEQLPCVHMLDFATEIAYDII